MTKLKLLIPLALLLLLFNACGVITKARYGNGLKLNLEFGRLAKNHPTITQKISHKKQTICPVKLLHKDSQYLVFNSNLFSSKNLTMKQSEKTLDYPSNICPDSNNTLPSSYKKSSLLKALIFQTKLDRPGKVETSSKLPIEPNTKWAAVLFYGAIITNAIILSLGIKVASIVFLPIAIAYVLGFILAVVGLRRIHDSGNAFRGKKLAKSIVIIFLSIMAYFLLVMGILALFFDKL